MPVLRDLVVCSLEPWDDVWRRNQFVVRGLLDRNPALRVLFVEPPRGRSAEPVCAVDDRLWTFRPAKRVPLSVDGGRLVRAAVRRAARRVGFEQPTLWVNDSSYAPLVRETGWPALYDITDDWLLAEAPRRHAARLRRWEDELLARAAEVVVCSPALAATRGSVRPAALIPNGVDPEHFARPRARPADLPPAPVAVYAGTLHDERIDVGLVEELAGMVRVILVGPDALRARSRERLERAGAVLLGPRPYADVPAYLQHADVVVVPHVVTPFTESLDPIKAYECRAVGVPTVATRCAGFRDLNGQVVAVARDDFVGAVTAALAAPARARPNVPFEITWDARVREFEAALVRARRAGA